MTEQPGRGFEDFGRKVDEHLGSAVPRIEEELKKVIAWMNSEVVPEVRRNSSKGLRAAAEQLAKLADHLERR